LVSSALNILKLKEVGIFLLKRSLFETGIIADVPGAKKVYGSQKIKEANLDFVLLMFRKRHKRKFFVVLPI
jgi:hypothetical protein